MKDKNTIKVIDAWGDDTGLRIAFTRFSRLSAYWRGALKAGRYNVTRVLRVEDMERDGDCRLLVTEGPAGPGFTEDDCTQNACRNYGRKCQVCSCRSEGQDEYTAVPYGAYILATRKWRGGRI